MNIITYLPNSSYNIIIERWNLSTIDSCAITAKIGIGHLEQISIYVVERFVRVSVIPIVAPYSEIVICTVSTHLDG
jgi:hypothetical protein